MPCDYPLSICWPLYRLSYFDKCLLITPLVSFGHCIVCPTSLYAFWLPLWYLFAIVSSVLLQCMPSDYPFGIFWPLYRLSYFDVCLLITPLVSFGHCIVCPTLIYAFWLPLWYLLAIVSSVLLWCMPSDYPFGIFWPLISSVLLRLMPSDYPFGILWPLYRLSYFDLCLLITTLVSFGHCIVCPTLICAFWLPLWYLLAIVSSVLLWFMPSDYHYGIFWPLYRLSYFDLYLLIAPLVSFGHCIVCPTSMYAFWLPIWYLLAIVSSVLLWFVPSDYPFGIFCPLHRLSYFDLCLLIAPLVSCAHCIVCSTSMYAFWLPIWYLLAIVSSVLLWFMPSDYPFGILWPLYRLSYFNVCLLITHLVSFAIVSSVLLWFVPSDYPFGIFCPLYRLSYFDLCLLIAPLVYFGHCIVCPTLIYAFWLSLRYLLAIVSSVLLRLMPSDYPFGILWPLYRLSYFDLCLLINSLVSFGHWIVCHTSINANWLPLCYMLAIVSSVLLRFMPSH